MALRPLFLLLVSLALATPLYSQGASAQLCASGPATADAAAAVDKVIAQYPQGGTELTKAIATLISTQPDDAAAVIAAAKSASSAVVSALAAGLAQGAALLVTTNPTGMAAIRCGVLNAGNAEFAATFWPALTVALAQNSIALAELEKWCETASAPFACSRIPHGFVSPN